MAGEIHLVFSFAKDLWQPQLVSQQYMYAIQDMNQIQLAM